jgi:serine/threonine-protein kinase 24/25/MST4
MGSFRSMARDLVPPDIIPDEDEVGSLFATAEDGDSLDTSAATKGSDLPPNSGNPNSEVSAGHSTVVIRSQLISHHEQHSVPLGDAPPSDASNPGVTDANTGPDLGDPPAYVRTPRRSSYAARTAPNGTIVREADLGTGVDTIRPVKKIDTTGSLRLSSEYVGSMRAREGREGSGSNSLTTSPTSPVKDKSSSVHKRAASDAAKAGRSLVDDVVLPALQKVSDAQLLGWLATQMLGRPSPTIWTRGRSNRSACCRAASKSSGTSTPSFHTMSFSIFLPG